MNLPLVAAKVTVAVAVNSRCQAAKEVLAIARGEGMTPRVHFRSGNLPMAIIFDAITRAVVQSLKKFDL